MAHAIFRAASCHAESVSQFYTGHRDDILIDSGTTASHFRSLIQGGPKFEIYLCQAVDGYLAGAMMIHRLSSKKYFIDNVLVHHDCRDQGIGTALIDHIKRMIDGTKLYRIVEAWVPEDAIGLCHYMAKRGFEANKLFPDEDGIPTVRFQYFAARSPGKFCSDHGRANCKCGKAVARCTVQGRVIYDLP